MRILHRPSAIQSFLGAYRKRYADEDGPPTESSLAKTINEIWCEKRDPKKVKQILEKYPKPQNVNCHKVDINVDVQNGLSRNAKNRNAKLRTIQGSVARCAVPALKIAEGVLTNKLTKSQLVERALDTVTMLAGANSQLNQFRRDALKFGLQPRYQSLCKLGEGEDGSQWLFGSNLSDRIKSAAAGGKVTRKPFQPNTFNMNTYGYGRGRRGGFHPYMPTGYAGRGAFGGLGYPSFGRGTRPFLGKSEEMIWEQSTKMLQTTPQSQFNETSVFNHGKFVVSRPEGQVHNRPGPSPEKGVKPQPTEANETEGSRVGKSIPQINVQKWGETFTAGRVSSCIEKWAEITSDHHILSDIRGYKLKFEEEPYQSKPMPELKMSNADKKFIRKEIKALLDKQVLVKAKPVAGEFISNIFLREKREMGNFRMILNLKHLNNFTEKIHFKMVTFMTTLALVVPNCEFLSFDFSDAYYSHHENFRCIAGRRTCNILDIAGPPMILLVRTKK